MNRIDRLAAIVIQLQSIGEPGIGYRLMDGYKLPPVMFNENEASALLTAGKLIEAMGDDNTSKHYISG